MTIQTLTGAAADAVVTESAFGPRVRLSEAHITEAQAVLESAFNGSRRGMLALQEAMASGDFQAAVFDILDREVLPQYEAITPVWSQYVSTTTVRDFRAKRMVDLLGGKAGLTKVPELTEYPARDVNKALYKIAVTKYGDRFAISWESIVNDDLDELRMLPENLAIAARDTESQVAASLLTAGNGPNPAYFNTNAWGRDYDPETDVWSGGSSNLLAGNPALTIDSLQAGLEAIKARRDPDNRPIMVPRYKLVVPSAMEITAQRVLNTLEVRVTSGDVQTIERNYVAGSVELVVDPWLDVIDGGANASTTWYLLPDPASSRKALFLGKLRGHEVPDLRVKADTGSRVGGGAIAPEEGSFDIDDIQYRVRHVLGSVGTDMIATIVSTGAGS